MMNFEGDKIWEAEGVSLFKGTGLQTGNFALIIGETIIVMPKKEAIDFAMALLAKGRKEGLPAHELRLTR